MELPPIVDLYYKEFLEDDRYEFVDKMSEIVYASWGVELHYVKDTLTGREMIAKWFPNLGKTSPNSLQHRMKCETFPLKKLASIPGIVQLYSVGKDFFLMEKLGKNLEFFIPAMNTKTVLHLADQLLTRLEQIHTRGIVHCDIKPANIVVGLEPETTLYLIDFDGHRTYSSESMRKMPIPKIDRSCFRGPGSLETVSLNIHYGGLIAPRDDLESMAYVFFWMLLKNLPWSKFNFASGELAQKYVDVCRYKAYFELPDGFPGVFMDFLKYARSLSHLDLPDYNAWRRRFRDVLESEEFAQESVINFSNEDHMDLREYTDEEFTNRGRA